MWTIIWGFYSSTVFFIDSNCPSSLITTTYILKSHYDLKNINDIGIYRESWTDIYYHNIDIFAILISLNHGIIRFTFGYIYLQLGPFYA